jgi:hypothetical protein
MTAREPFRETWKAEALRRRINVKLVRGTATVKMGEKPAQAHSCVDGSRFNTQQLAMAPAGR